jgi:hypothetical protein
MLLQHQWLLLPLLSPQLLLLILAAHLLAKCRAQWRWKHPMLRQQHALQQLLHQLRTPRLYCHCQSQLQGLPSAKLAAAAAAVGYDRKVQAAACL